MSSMSSCTEEKLVVETEKGTYTFPHDDMVVGKSAAEKKCTELNSILAPFTEKSEFVAVMNAVNSCDHKEKYEYSLIGLSIAEDNSTRVFSNGVQFDYQIHGDLYRENQVTMPKNCPEAYFNPLSQDKLEIESMFGCKPRHLHPYVCFKQKVFVESEVISGVAMDARSEAISGDVMDVNSKLLTIGGLFQFALVCLVCFMFVQIKQLKSRLSQKTSDLA